MKDVSWRSNLIRKNSSVLVIYCIFLIAGISCLLTMNRAELHLALNGVDTEFLDTYTHPTAENAPRIDLTSPIHTASMDVFFKCVTFLGEWFPFLVIGIIMLFRFGHGFGALAAQGLSTIITQTVKRTLAAPRPRKFFSENFPDLNLPLPEGFIPHWTHSFPSGHTSSIFALLVFMILMTRNPWMKTFYLLLAILVGYSRIYLSQHFADDVLAGSFVGAVSAVVMWYCIPQDRKWYMFSPLGALCSRIRKK